MRRRTVAVLGAGITGTATALLLARAGHDVHLFDQADAAMSAASRWNEGKIHLGFLYAADPSGRTADRVLTGGLAFGPLVEQLIDEPVAPATTQHDDTYVVHRDSVVDRLRIGRYFETVMDRVATHPDAHRYLVDLRSAAVRPVPDAELTGWYDTETVLAGFRVPERSVSTQWLADRLVTALAAEPRITACLSTRVTEVRARDDADDGPFTVVTADGSFGDYDWCVNATWEGRPAIDRRLGLHPPAPWTHRFRQSVFVRTVRPVDVRSTVVAVGPFGDVKNYDGRTLYLSWYDCGLRASGMDIEPPPVPDLTAAERETLAAQVVEQLSRLIPDVGPALADAVEVRVEGGWVYAVGTGSLADADATLHRRDRIGIQRRGRYLSVDTGKYSIGPWLAARVARVVTATE